MWRKFNVKNINKNKFELMDRSAIEIKLLTISLNKTRNNLHFFDLLFEQHIQ